MLIVAAFDFFHTLFDLIACKAHIVVKIFHLHLSQVDFYVSDSGTGHGIDDGQDEVNLGCHHKTINALIKISFVP